MALLPVISVPWRRLGSVDSQGRPIYFTTIPTIAAAMELPLPSGVFFKLFIASEVSQQHGDLSYKVAKHFVFAGCCCMCAWGESCSDWDDDFDHAVVVPRVDESHDFEYPDDLDHNIMTTWHDNQSLDDARRFFASSAEPADGFRDGCSLCFALAIGGEVFGAKIESSLLKGAERPDDSP